VSTDTPQSFVPDLRAARAAGVTARGRSWLPFGGDLLTRVPRHTSQLACVVVRARLVVRTAREERVDVSERKVGRIPEPMPALPLDFVEGHQRALMETLGQAEACTRCQLSTGRVECSLCDGRGYQMVEERVATRTYYRRVECTGCDQQGWYTCTTCEGTGRSVPVRAMTVSDQEQVIRYTYLPPLPLALGEQLLTWFEETLPRDTTPPAPLLVSLARPESDNPYRSSVREVEPSFHGFSLAGALPAARDAVERLRGLGDIAREDVQAFAWPFLHLNYGLIGAGTDVAILVDPSGRLRAIVG